MSTPPHQIVAPFINSASNKRFDSRRREYLHSAIPSLYALTASTSLHTLIASAGIAQNCPVDTVVIYPLMFDEARRVGMVGHCVPSTSVRVEVGSEEGYARICEVVGTEFLRGGKGRGVQGDEGSVCVVKIVVFGREVGVVVRVDVEREKGQGKEVGAGGNGGGSGPEMGWWTRAQVEGLRERVVQPTGIARLVIEAFRQREFEGAVVAFD